MTKRGMSCASRVIARKTMNRVRRHHALGGHAPGARPGGPRPLVGCGEEEVGCGLKRRKGERGRSAGPRRGGREEIVA